MFLKRLTVLLYVTIILFLGSTLVLFALNILKFDTIFFMIYAIYHDQDLRFIVGSVGAVILVCNFLFYRYFSVNVHRDKIIAFDNPSGRVSVSLLAMEDLIKRLLLKTSEVKDARVKISARKKGLDVRVRVILKLETSIPDITSRLQDRIKRKIQDTIGLEEPVDVSIYVGKIMSEKLKKKVVIEDAQAEDENLSTPTIPFQGYRS